MRTPLATLRLNRRYVLIALLATALGGCSKPQEEKAPPLVVKTVDSKGVSLGPQASPQQVAYVLLSALAEDVRASQAHRSEDQKVARDLAFSLVAPKALEARILGVNAQFRGKREARLEDRDQKLYIITNSWAPIVAHYIADFPADPAAAAQRMWVRYNPGMTVAHVYLVVAHDPAEADSAKRETATLDIEMAREAPDAGGDPYWRAVRISYLGRNPIPPMGLWVVEAYGILLNENATPERVSDVARRALAEAATPANADPKASAIMRLMCLSVSSAQAVSQAVEPGGQMVATVEGWIARAGSNPQIQLAPQQSGEKTYLRITGIGSAAAPPGPATASAPGR